MNSNSHFLIPLAVGYRYVESTPIRNVQSRIGHKDWNTFLTGTRGEGIKAIANLGTHLKSKLHQLDEKQNFTDEVFTSFITFQRQSRNTSNKSS